MTRIRHVLSLTAILVSFGIIAAVTVGAFN